MLPEPSQKIPFTDNLLDDFVFLSDQKCYFFNPENEVLVVLPGPSSRSLESETIIRQASSNIDVCYVNPREVGKNAGNRNVIFATADQNVLRRLLGMNHKKSEIHNIYPTLESNSETKRVLYLDGSIDDDKSFYNKILNESPHNIYAEKMAHKSSVRRLQLGSGLSVIIYLLSIGVKNITVLGFDEYLPRIDKGIWKSRVLVLLGMLSKSEFPHRILTGTISEQLLVAIYLFRIKSNPSFKISLHGRINELMKLLSNDKDSLFKVLYKDLPCLSHS
tara:strand:+ start:1600 stop:2427 length:828 start_codon:yes stop_codon:yes gene_type:complete